ncbi:MAG: glycosyltransferase, partial [Acidobacteriota bacterium]
RSVDRHVAVNRDIASALERKGAAAERIALIHHGVAVPDGASDEDRAARRAAQRRRLSLPENAVVVGSFIRLHAQKRPLDIVRLARRFARDPGETPVAFLLVGGGPLAPEVDAELARSPVPGLVRLPMTRRPLPLYDALDICLMTSAYEGLPVFLLDGLARGIPGVAPAVGDIPLLFSGGGGLLAESPGHLNALEAALRELLDPAERARRGALGRRTVRDSFGLERYLASYRRHLLGEFAP